MKSIIALLLAVFMLVTPLMAQAQRITAEPAIAAEDDYLDDYEYERDAAMGDNASQIDHMEGLNRAIFGFNKGLDTALIRPVSEVYRFVFPRVARDRVTLFFDNLRSPVVFLNSVLQGDPQNSFVTFWRFVINSTLGVAGLFDMATELGVPARNEEDFGQTLGVWGVGHGSYLVLPVMGSTSLRDTVGFVVDIFSNPFTYVFTNADDDALTIGMVAGQIIDTRTRYGKLIDTTYENSLDPYATFRSLYLQRREAQLDNMAENPTMLQPVTPSGRI